MIIAKVLLIAVCIVACNSQNGGVQPQVQNGFNNNPAQGFPTPFNNNNNQPGFQPNGAFNGQQNPPFNSNNNGQGGFGFGQGAGGFDSSAGPSGSGQHQGPNGGWSYSYNTSAAAKISAVNIWMTVTVLATCVGGLLRQSV